MFFTVKEGKIISYVALFLFLIHTWGCLLWLLSLSLLLAALTHWPFSVFHVQFLRQNNNCSETTLSSSYHVVFNEVWLSSSMNPKNWSHSLRLSTASNFLFTTSGVFVFSNHFHSCIFLLAIYFIHMLSARIISTAVYSVQFILYLFKCCMFVYPSPHIFLQAVPQVFHLDLF